jgi:hypothetical protein
MPKIAISYWRTEADATGRIYDRLVQRYGRKRFSTSSLRHDLNRLTTNVPSRMASIA